MNNITWIITVFSIIGVVLNIYKNKWCFIVWIFTNFSWMIIDFYHKLYAQAFLFLIYFILAILGFIKWHRQNKKENKNKEYKSKILRRKI